MDIFKEVRARRQSCPDYENQLKELSDILSIYKRSKKGKTIILYGKSKHLYNLILPMMSDYECDLIVGAASNVRISSAPIKIVLYAEEFLKDQSVLYKLVSPEALTLIITERTDFVESLEKRVRSRIPGTNIIFNEVRTLKALTNKIHYIFEQSPDHIKTIEERIEANKDKVDELLEISIDTALDFLLIGNEEYQASVKDLREPEQEILYAIADNFKDEYFTPETLITVLLNSDKTRKDHYEVSKLKIHYWLERLKESGYIYNVKNKHKLNILYDEIIYSIDLKKIKN
eukprot:GHVP01021131.1.p1 GENE.GHVP01021131.1~~GHVP01021131.1.p1  ORF type:complete len:288 (+),score=45.70 GHVP01021131.1:2-865(+)